MASSQTHSSNEMQKLVNSLPAENSSGHSPVCLYNGFWYPPTQLPGIIASRGHFQAQDTDIILATAPKSGTTWLKALVFAIAKRTQHPISDPNHPLLATNPHGLVHFLHEENQLPEISSPPPRLISVHVPYSMLPESVLSSKCPVIYLCRDPKDVFVSLWHFAKKLVEQPVPVPISVAFDKFCKGVTWYGPCWDQALEYWKMSSERPEKVLFLKYEDLTEDITSQVKKIAEHLGCPFSAEEEKEGVIDGIVRMCSFEHLRELEVNTGREKPAVLFVENKAFFRNGRVGDWMNHLTPSMAQQLDKVVQEKLQGSGLTLN